MGCNNLNNGGMTIPNYFEMVPQPVKVLKGRVSHPNLSKQIHFTYKNMAGKSANKNSMVHSTIPTPEVWVSPAFWGEGFP